MINSLQRFIVKSSGFKDVCVTVVLSCRRKNSPTESNQHEDPQRLLHEVSIFYHLHDVTINVKYVSQHRRIKTVSVSCDFRSRLVRVREHHVLAWCFGSGRHDHRWR